MLLLPGKSVRGQERRGLSLRARQRLRARGKRGNRRLEIDLARNDYLAARETNPRARARSLRPRLRGHARCKAA